MKDVQSGVLHNGNAALLNRSMHTSHHDALQHCDALADIHGDPPGPEPCAVRCAWSIPTRTRQQVKKKPSEEGLREGGLFAVVVAFSGFTQLDLTVQWHAVKLNVDGTIAVDPGGTDAIPEVNRLAFVVCLLGLGDLVSYVSGCFSVAHGVISFLTVEHGVFFQPRKRTEGKGRGIARPAQATQERGRLGKPLALWPRGDPSPLQFN
jgi:hypothetical protein